jgi:release factor glutamine methyltransferase
MKKKEIFQFWKELWLEINKIEKIILKITDLSKSQLFLLDDVQEKCIEDIKKAFIRLQNWEPLEYIINKAEFYSFDFYVNPKVLIPRNDTEVIVDKAIEQIVTIPKDIDKKTNITLIDVWTWSSCIVISILKNTEKINNSYVIDISKKALEVSRKNIVKYNLEKKIQQIHWNLLTDFLTTNEYELKKHIVITANLPYIKDNDHENMDIETITHEPALALYWWKETWFELYEQLIRECIQLKNIHHLKTITLFIEIWFDQKEYSENHLKNLNLKFEIFKDNWGIERCIKIEF